MKSLMVILVAVMAVPAMAVVNFTATDAGSGKLQIAYTSPEGDAPRGVALRISLSDGAMVDFAAPVVVDAAFNAYIDYAYSNPLTYNLDAGKGHPLAKFDMAGALEGDASQFSISMGVLDQTGAQKPGPVTTANLITIQLKQGTAASTTVSITADTLRGPASGVVGSVLNSNLPQSVVVNFAPVECVKSTAAFYADWVSFGKPDCWCFKRQCRGDVNGIKELIGVAQIGATDLNIFKGAFGKAAAQIPAGGICADLNHAKELIGVARVGATDLAQFKLYYGKSEANIPECPNTDYNFWIK